MYSLAIDTSTERGAFALFSDKTVIFSEYLPFGFQTAQALLPSLESRLKEHAFDLSALNYIAIGAGPGSYTGIRIGVTVAKTLSFVWKIPLVGICSLDGFIPSQDGNFAAIIDAKIGGVYMQLGRLSQGVIVSLTKPDVYTLKDAASLLKGLDVIVTPNAGKIQPKLLDFGIDPLIPWEESYPSCIRLVSIGLERINAGGDLKFEVMYLRKTQAEIERNRS